MLLFALYAYQTMTSGWQAASHFERYGRYLVSKPAISFKELLGAHRRKTFFVENSKVQPQTNYPMEYMDKGRQYTTKNTVLGYRLRTETVPPELDTVRLS